VATAISLPPIVWVINMKKIIRYDVELGHGMYSTQNGGFIAFADYENRIMEVQLLAHNIIKYIKHEYVDKDMEYYENTPTELCDLADELAQKILELK